jgi:hypothetical protein
LIFQAGAPIYYDHANMLISHKQPNTVHSQNTAMVAYFRRYLLQKTISVFEWKLPETWNRDYFLYCLYCWGVVAVVRTDKFGVIPQGCGLKGYNVFYAPTNAIITNPLLRGILEPEIGTECEIFKLQPDYGGIMDLVNSTAEDLALCSEALSMNVINSKLSYLFGASNKAAAESFKKVYDEIAKGNPAVVLDTKLFTKDGKPSWVPFSQDLKSNFIAPDIVDVMHEIEARFDQQIGIPSANRDKKERLTTDEVNVNNVDTYSKCALWLESLQDSCRRVNAMFGLNVSVDWRAIPQEISGDTADPETEGGGEDG